ncbi:glycosyltransferase family 87 protein [Endozoicomonas arenosclerae]|uniref:glycosyltransferase family 87 protein n=1 Tax=Endozoicomonas arenosclerae TaxID=1633495 RepID=UPI000782C5AD|nr:glycosyltransferase family 87 protein [Endozoicomonas arenosclerae]
MKDITLLKNHPAALFGVFLWGLAVILIFAKVILEPGQHTVLDSYLLGADRWIDRVKLYSGPGGFIYTPTFAVLFVPVTKLPLFLADLLWRLFIIGLYAWASFRLLSHFYVFSREKLFHWFGLFSVIAVPIAFSGFRNGQMNVVLISAMMLVISQIIEKRWNSAALVLALIMSLKPTFIVFFLLATTLFRPFWLRVPLMLLAFLALPLVFGGLDYGLEQYNNFLEMADSAVERGITTPTWASFFNIPMQLIHYSVPEGLQNIIKLILAALTWMVCFYAIVRHGTKNGLIYLLSFSACYHVMFNPRSVNTDYIILGSVLAFWFVCAAYLWREKNLAWTTGLISLGVLFAFDISRTLVTDATSWFNPLMAAVFTGVLIWQLCQKRVFAP